MPNVNILAISRTFNGIPVEGQLNGVTSVVSVAGGNVTVTGGSGAPVDAKYIVLAANSTLTNERILTAGSGVSLVDGGAGGPLTISSAGGDLLVGNTLFVDAVNGDDGTGTRGDASKPFLTLAAAIAEAESGDTVNAGTGAFDTAAMVPGVNLTLAAGCEITMQLAGSPLFDDVAGAISASLFGYGDLISVDANPLISFIDPDSFFSCDVRTITGGLGNFMIRQSDGEITIRAKEIATDAIGFIWWASGQCDIEAVSITQNTGDYSAIFLALGSATQTVGQLHVRADTITSSNVSGTITFDGAESIESRIWIRANLLQNTDVEQYVIFQAGGSRLYIETLKTKGIINAQIDGGEFFLRTQKHNGRLVSSGSQGTDSFWNIDELDDTGVATSTAIITVSGGNVTIKGMAFTGSATTYGISLSGGTLTLVDCIIDTSACDATSPITVSGGTLILNNCTLIANNSVNAIDAPGSVFIGVVGTLTTNRPLNNVTISYGTLSRTDDSSLAILGTMTAGGFVGPLTGTANGITLAGTNGSTLNVGTGGTLGTAAYTAASAYQPVDSDLTSWAAITRASGFDTFVATPSSANLRALLTDETGTGIAYFVGGELGTPASGTLTNCTGLPAGSIASIGSGVATLITTAADGTSASGIGYQGIPQNSQSAAYTIAASDDGKEIYHPASDANARTFTINSNANLALPIGFVFSIYNDSANAVTLAITTDTLVLAGKGSTGSRTIAQYGLVTVRKVTATRWSVSGVGVT